MHSPDEPVERNPAAANGCILLFGLPRSGTTWLGKLFDSHPDTLYRHEPDTSQRFPMLRYPSIDDAEAHAPMLREFVNQLPRMNTLRVAGKLPIFPKSYMSAVRARILGSSVLLARGASRFFPGFPVLGHAAGDGQSQRRVVWKSIESLGRMRVILQAIDDAAGIQILRHPCGHIASLERGFGKDTDASKDYGIFHAAIGTELGDRYDLTIDYLKGLRPEERLAWRWVLINEKALIECADNKRFLCVRYEDICSDPGKGVERMFAFAGLDMHPQTRAFIDSSTSQSSDDYYSVFRDPEEAAWRWREQLDKQTVSRIMTIVSRSRVGQFYMDSPAKTVQTA